MNIPTITDFAGETLPGDDAEILLAAYGSEDQATWRADAELTAAAILNRILPDASISVSTEPWTSILKFANGKTTPEEIEDALYDALDLFDPPVKRAVYSYLSLMIHRLAIRYQGMKLGAQPNSNRRQKRITTRLIQSPDPKLKLQIENELIPDKRPAYLRLGNIEALLLNWLNDHGQFVHAGEGQYYYLYRDTHQLYDLDSERWQAFLHTLTGVNPAMKSTFGQLTSAAQTAAMYNAKETPVVKFAHYDRETQILRVSRFDGTVYMLDGEHIDTEINGEGPALFYDFPAWQPYSPTQTDQDFLHELACLPVWKQDADLYRWVFQVWVQTLFFTELCPTRPIMVFLGEKGSGKSMILRLLMKLLFGIYADISSIPDKPDAFAVAAHYYHLYVLDNMDTLETWIRDKLARISTGATDEYRRLYTSKEMGIIRYRTWLAVTARTPDTLRRDDLADRVVILPLKRLEDDQRGRELDFLEWAETHRNEFWYSLLAVLNQAVTALRTGNTPIASPLRMADWEMLGRILSRTQNKEDAWDRLVNSIKSEQRHFLADGEIIIEAVETWLTNPANLKRWVTARELYNESQYLLFSNNKPDSDWPRSVKSFGWRLKNITDYLQSRFGMKVMDFRGGTMMKYYFDKP